MNASRLRHYFLQIEQTDKPKHTFKGTRDIHVHVGSFKNRRKGVFISNQIILPFMLRFLIYFCH